MTRHRTRILRLEAQGRRSDPRPDLSGRTLEELLELRAARLEALAGRPELRDRFNRRRLLLAQLTHTGAPGAPIHRC